MDRCVLPRVEQGSQGDGLHTFTPRMHIERECSGIPTEEQAAIHCIMFLAIFAAVQRGPMDPKNRHRFCAFAPDNFPRRATGLALKLKA